MQQLEDVLVHEGLLRQYRDIISIYLFVCDATELELLKAKGRFQMMLSPSWLVSIKIPFLG